MWHFCQKSVLSNNNTASNNTVLSGWCHSWTVHTVSLMIAGKDIWRNYNNVFACSSSENAEMRSVAMLWNWLNLHASAILYIQKLTINEKVYCNFYILPFWLEIAYSRPFLGVLGAYFPQMTSPVILTPKRHFLTQKHVVWAIKRENRFSGSTWARSREKKDRTGQSKEKVTKW